jgi:ATP-binding cassette subfamily B protein
MLRQNPLYYLYLIGRKKILYLLFFLSHPLFKGIAIIFPSFFIKEVVRLLSHTEVLSRDILFISLSYFVFLLFYFFYGWLYQRYIQIFWYASLRCQVSEETLRTLMYNDVSFFREHTPGEIAHLLIHLNENIIDFLKILGEQVLPRFFAAFFLVIFLLYHNTLCGFFLFGWLVATLVLSFLIVDKIDRYLAPLIRHKSQLSDIVVDVLQNISIVKVFCSERRELFTFSKKLSLIEEKEQAVGEIHTYFFVFYNLCFFVLHILLTLVIVFQYRRGTVVLPGIILLWNIVSTISSLAETFLDSMLTLPRFYYGMKESLIILTQEKRSHFAGYLSFEEGGIEFFHVFFSIGKTVILEDFSLKIGLREKVALVGFSGSGKTTLLFLLLRLYKPDSGSIFINGKNINDIDNEELYEAFSAVLQTKQIFNRPVWENICYQKEIEEVNWKRLREVLGVVGFDFENESSERSFLDKNALSFSGGEQQRISLARALYEDKSIYLFDEPTSNIDRVTEERIMRSITAALENKTLLLVTHNFHILPYIDRIIVIDNGQVKQDGSHGTLIEEENGVYAKMVRLGKIV